MSLSERGIRRCRLAATRPGQDGAILILFALLAFGLFGVLSLSLDLGMVVLTRHQMQTAADAAALEGIRFRDMEGLLPSEREIGRRIAASRHVALVFDDDLFDGDTDPYDDPYQFGAGPAPEMSPGFTEVQALQTIDLDARRVWKPRGSDWFFERSGLEPNADNFVHGDMVAGTYLGLAGPTPIAREELNYERNDFQPAPVRDTAAAVSSPSFLVRLRRTRDAQGLDNQPETSSSGPPLPYLWGRGSAMHKVDDEEVSYSPRRDGITVRATAIANTAPAMSVGASYNLPGSPVIGAVPFGLERSFWAALPIGSSSGQANVVEVQPDGSLMDEGAVVGWFLESPPWVGVAIQTRPPEAGSQSVEGYVPIYQQILGVRRVVGFGLIRLDPAPGGSPNQRQLTKRASGIAVRNASAIPAPVLSGLTPEEIDQLWFANRTLEEPVLAPVLAR